MAKRKRKNRTEHKPIGLRAPPDVQEAQTAVSPEAIDQTMMTVSGLRPTEEVGNNPKDRYGLAKVPLTMLPTPSLVFMAMAMKGGAIDYGPQNYRVEKVQARVYLEAALRHLLALIDGEDIDPKRGVHHGGFIMATVGIYLDAMVTGNLIDNRVLPGPTGDLIELFNDLPGETATPEELRIRYERFMFKVNAKEI